MKVVEITSNEQLESIKDEDFTCLFIKSKGCQHCETATPFIEELSQKQIDISFKALEFSSFSETLDFYSKFAEYEQKTEVVRDKDGNPVTDENGNILIRNFFNEDGSPMMTPKIIIPTFLLFHKSCRDEDDEYGFVGRISGHTPEKLEGVLSQFQRMLNEEE